MAAAPSGPGHLGLTDNQKHWAVSGIALNTILIPEIRPFVAQEVSKEYIGLKASHNIHTQNATGHLQKWPPGGKFLKYENINGNDVIPKLPGRRYDYAKFDCKVLSHVDFAKLYVENHMAKFSAFNDHCDASTVLSLLTGVPVFLCPVQAAAAPVRRARNDWAHSAFSKWDQLKFQQSFDEMANLVQAMALPAADKGRILVGLKDWEVNGKKLLMNSPVDPALLQLFQKELNSLHDVVSMAAETKEEEMKICHEIQNIVICVEEMKQRIEKLEMGHVNTLHQTEQIENRVTNLEVLKDKTQSDVENLQDEVKVLQKTTDELLQRDVPGKDEMVTNVITVAPEPSLTVAGGFDQAMGIATRGEEVRNEIPSSNNNQHLTHNPLQLQFHHSSSDPDPDQLCAGGNTLPPQHPHLLPVSVGNRRLNGPSPDDSSPEKNPVLPTYLQLSSVSENISLDKPAPDELSPGENPLPPQDPRLAASIGNNNVSEPAPDKLSPGENPLPAQDLHLGSLAENNTLIDPGPDELSPVENPVPPQDLQLTTQAGNNSLVEPAPDELSLEENPLPPHGLQLVTLPGSNNVNEPAALDEIHPAENVVPPLVEQDVMAEQGLGIISSLGHVDVENLDEQMDSLSAVPELNENVHQPQNADQPVRPNLFTQNSCYDQPNEFRDENDTPYGVNETAASPKHRITPPSIEQTEDLRRMLEGQLSTAGAATSRISSLVAEPFTHHNTSSGELEHFKPDSLVKDEIVSKVKIMDMLSLHLDRSVRLGRRGVPLTQRWEHLADELKVPDKIKRQCENFTGKLQSPSECMFEHLCMTKGALSIEALKVQLLELKRKDVADELDNNSSLSDEATITDLCNDYPETLNAVCLKLDDIRGPINWYYLGMRLGIPGGTLRKFKDPKGHSPSQVILQKIATLRPNLSITTIAAALEKEVPTAAKVLNELSAGSTIKTLLGNLDVSDKVTALLDLQESSWMHFGSKFNINRLELESLKPDPVCSPTKVLMECLVQNDPDLTMATFLESLEKIKRHDVIDELTRFFYPRRL